MKLEIVRINSFIDEDVLEDIGKKIIKTTRIKKFDLKNEETMFGDGYEIDVGSFLRILSYCYENVLGITSCDLKNGEEYIFGASLITFQKIIAIVSTYRLDTKFYGKDFDYGILKERITKEAIHEIGHCYGLSHHSFEKKTKTGKLCPMVIRRKGIEKNIERYVEEVIDERDEIFCDSCEKFLYSFEFG